MFSKPQVSVILPVRNSAGVLRGVYSILEQTLASLELIVVDDASTDETSNLLAEIALSDHRIRVITLRHHQGVAAALNVGIRDARADLIARMDADDVAVPHRLERQVAFLNSRPDVGVVGSAFIRVFEDTGEEIAVRLPEEDREILRALSFSCVLCHPSVLVRKQCFEQAGFYDESVPRAQDYELWLRWRSMVVFHNLQEELVRLHCRRYFWETQKGTNRLEPAINQLRIRVNSIRRGRFPLRDSVGLTYWACWQIADWLQLKRLLSSLRRRVAWNSK